MPDADGAEFSELKLRVEQLEANQERLLKWLSLMTLQAEVAADAMRSVKQDSENSDLKLSVALTLAHHNQKSITQMVDQFDGNIDDAYPKE